MNDDDDDDEYNGEGESEGSEEIPEDNLNRAKYVLDLVDKEGNLEAPIRLKINDMTIIELNPLMWYNHDIAPKKIKITNTGHTVILSAKWHEERPYIIDGPFFGKYVFSQLHFHWGEDEMAGSEHYVDGRCTPMELHAVHFKADYRSQDEAMRHWDGLAILVYLFRLQDSANPNLDGLLSSLPRIQKADSSTRLEPVQPLLDWLRPFSDDYFLYWGALMAAGQPQRLLWLVNREPIGVALEQIDQFRSLRNRKNHPIISNCNRPTKRRQVRHVFHVNPAKDEENEETLLPVPSGPPPLTANKVAEMVENYEAVKETDEEMD